VRYSGGTLTFFEPVLSPFVGHDVGWTVSPESPHFGGLEFPFVGQVNHIVRAHIEDVGDVFGPQQGLLLGHHIFTSQRGLVTYFYCITVRRGTAEEHRGSCGVSQGSEPGAGATDHGKLVREVCEGRV
jgi:hypothetical protein